MRLLADTSALLALARKDDQHHDEARTFLRRSGPLHLVTSDLVLGELATRLRARASAAVAASVVGDYLRSRRCSVHFIDSELFEAALFRMTKHADKRLSLTDCASFELMDRLEISGAFTFDADFRNCGYRMAP